MLTFAFILAFASAAFEIGIAEKIPAYRRLAGKYMLVNLAGSVALSYTMGMLFGAGGLIAMTAGIMSTIMNIPYYKGRFYYDNNSESIHKGLGAFRDLGKMVVKFVVVITWPVRFCRAILQILNERRSVA